MPVVLRSKPSVARDRVSASRAMDSDMAREEFLSAVARDRSEFVKFACVAASDSRIGTAELDGEVDSGAVCGTEG